MHFFFGQTYLTKFNCYVIPGPSGSGNPLAIVGPGGDILGPTEERESIAPNQASNEQQVYTHMCVTKPASASNDSFTSSFILNFVIYRKSFKQFCIYFHLVICAT